MKYIFKSFLLSICILCLAPALSTAKETPMLQADYQIQPSSIFDITYAVLIWTPVSTLFNPRYVDQFEFKAGDVFSAYTTKRGELTGTWIETVVGPSTWFQAWVQKEETSTTTTTPATTTTPQTQSTGNLRLNQLNEKQLKFDINIWGVSFTFVPPPPLDTFGFSTIFGYGAYLGADAFFLGFASVPGTGEEPEFGSVSPAEGVLGDKITVTITGTNTNFQTGQTKVFWGEGITNVGTPDVDSPTELSQQIEIADDAPLGKTSVSVTFPGGSITGTDEFEIKEKTQ
jgi:hypothetical protein